MHSTYHRANAVAAYALSVFFCAILAISAFSYFYQSLDWRYQLAVKNQSIIYANYDRYGVSNGGKQDHLFLDLQLDTDLSSLFHWTTKGAFVYLMLEYWDVEKRYQRNQMVVWDRIHLDSAEHYSYNENKHRLNHRYESESIKNKYHLRDITRQWRGRKVNITMVVEIIPHFGVLRHLISDQYQTITLPNEYSTSLKK